MSDFVQITTTTAKRDDAQAIAAALVDRRLAACVQVVGPITSTYRWKGAIETAEEWMCIIKTGRDKFPEIQALLKESHPYDVPELIATPIVAGSDAYLAWIAEQLEN